MNPAVVRLTKLVILMSFAAHIAVSGGERAKNGLQTTDMGTILALEHSEAKPATQCACSSLINTRFGQKREIP